MEEQASRQKTITEDNREDEARQRRKRRIREMQRRKRRQQELRRKVQIGAPIAAGVLILCIVAGISITAFRNSDDIGGSHKKEDMGVVFQPLYTEKASSETSDKQKEELLTADKLANGGMIAVSALGAQSTGIQTEEGKRTLGDIIEDVMPPVVYSANVTADTLQLGQDFPSEYAIFVDLSSHNILAQKSADTRISPASMTKILTLLVAAEYLEDFGDLDDTFTITHAITSYVYSNDCSSVGFADNETVTVEDLLYGTILPSGADAAMGLAEYVAGSHEAFVEMMNKKLKELGLSDTAHVTNCVGLYNADHYCTAYDMAMIMEAAMNNELCRKIMSTRTYTTSSTTQHSNGIEISNWFLRRIEDLDTGGEVICGKTGYVSQSGNCAASYGIDRAGKEYICVTARANSGWRCIYDHVELYKQFSASNDSGG